MEHTIALIERSQQGDKEAREQLMEENTGLIWCVVKRFYGRGLEAEDLFQIGCIGLLKAIDKFDQSYQVRFSTYAVPMISGEIKRFLRDDGMIKVSRSLKELSYKASIGKNELLDRLKREPTIEELAEHLSVEKEELVLAIDATNEVESLHKKIYLQDGNEVTLLEKLAQTEKKEYDLENQILLKQLLENMKREEKQLVILRYFADKTQAETGKILGISQVQVSRLEKKILQMLRENMEKV